ncbi:MAG: hypothetical protein KGZ42_12750 [Melioribacter sp.]|nr:hypothetical protein [Melioribacter sp.]
MKIKIGIHHNANSFSDYWIKYCIEQNIDYKLINCYSNSIIEETSDCNIILWHINQNNYRDNIFAKNLLNVFELAGKKVFPDFKTRWTFDDKISQKYLLESINAPLPPTYIFYDEKEALAWSKTTTYPKVFKLSCGAGSSNVKLVKSRRIAIKLIKKVFRSGFNQFDSFVNLRERIRKYQSNIDRSILKIIKGVIRLFVPSEFSKMSRIEKGYIYFQDFISNNDSDIRIIIIGEKAFAIKRMIRDKDFRASGSGFIKYEKEFIDIELIKMAFELNDKIKAQCVAFDFIYSSEYKPLLLEISFGFIARLYEKCVGYWDKNLQFHAGQIHPQCWIIENLIKDFSIKYNL